MDIGELFKEAAHNAINSQVLSIQCPKCKKGITLSLNDDKSIIKCPNCNSDIKVTVNRH